MEQTDTSDWFGTSGPFHFACNAILFEQGLTG